MKVISLSGDFGRLTHESLSFQKGLNVIQLPNEGGKSTWCALLRAMLYGIDSRERDKAGFLADKNRYAPWSGAPMAGVLECEHNGRRLRIRRGADKRQPFALLAVEDMDTGLPIPELMSTNLGELLTGVTREVYERTCFIPQGQMAVSPNGALERRIAGLVHGGEEDASFSAAMTRLKDWRNRRGRSGTGLVPKLEHRRDEVRAVLREQQGLRDELERKQAELTACEQSVAALEQESLTHQALAAQKLHTQIEEAKSAWQQAERAAEALESEATGNGEPLDPLFDGMTGEQAMDRARQDAAAVENAVAQRAQAELQGLKYKAQGGVLLGLAALMAIVAAVSAVFLPRLAAGLLPAVPLLLLGFAIILAALAIPRLRKGPPVPQDDVTAIFQRYDAVDTRDVIYRATSYVEALSRRVQQVEIHAQRLAAARDTAAQLKSSWQLLQTQAGQVPTVTADMAAPTRSADDTAAMLRMVKSRLEQLGREVSRDEGRLTALGDWAALTAEEEQLTAQIRARQEELEAIRLAEEQLTAANTLMRERFSPAINQLASTYFSKLTGNAWEQLRISPDFTAQALQPGEPLPRQDLFLSGGTLDQLYLAVRLAICTLTYEGADAPPLVLDDALVQFDDARLALVLETFSTLDRQVLLFTCQGREAASI